MLRILYVMVAVCLLALVSAASAVSADQGEALFKQHCALCHPEGGNIINPKKTLKKKDLHANSIKSASDIVGVMRNPGPGMNSFDAKTIPDADAKKIAEYILNTFK